MFEPERIVEGGGVRPHREASKGRMARFSLDQDDLDAIRAIIRDEIAAAVARADRAPSVWMDDKDAAKLLGFERSYLRTAVRTYAIPHSRIGKAYRFRRSDLDAWLAARNGR